MLPTAISHVETMASTGYSQGVSMSSVVSSGSDVHMTQQQQQQQSKQG